MDENESTNDNDIIQDVMASMGWQNSFLPVASEENKKLMMRIKSLGVTKLERNDDLVERGNESQRVGSLLNNIEYEFDQNLKLINAHKSQFADEHHLFKLSEHEETKFKKILKELTENEKELKIDQEKLKSRLEIETFN
jgi:hypothetical protein